MEDVDFLVDYLAIVSMKTSGKTRVSIGDLSSHITYKTINPFSQYLKNNGINNIIVEVINPFYGINVEDYLIEFIN